MEQFALKPRWRERIKEIPSPVEAIHMPSLEEDLRQDQEWCEVEIEGHRRRFRFHDYGEIYEVPGLYERIFYDQLKCCSPSRVVGLLREVLRDEGMEPANLRVLDLGAGNGMVGDELQALGADSIIGVDIIPQAQHAADRDRPGVYDDYYVEDLTQLSSEAERGLRQARLNCLTGVATLGFGDTPPTAFLAALDLIATPGWLAFNIKETFLNGHDNSGFSRLVRRLTSDEIIRIEAYRRYRHRCSISGEPLHYVAMVARKLKDAPRDSAH
jgi:predicted TPR repeat methyltransferase